MVQSFGLFLQRYRDNDRIHRHLSIFADPSLQIESERVPVASVLNFLASCVAYLVLATCFYDNGLKSLSITTIQKSLFNKIFLVKTSILCLFLLHLFHVVPDFTSLDYVHEQADEIQQQSIVRQLRSLFHKNSFVINSMILILDVLVDVIAVSSHKNDKGNLNRLILKIKRCFEKNNLVRYTLLYFPFFVSNMQVLMRKTTIYQKVFPSIEFLKEKKFDLNDLNKSNISLLSKKEVEVLRYMAKHFICRELGPLFLNMVLLTLAPENFLLIFIIGWIIFPAIESDIKDISALLHHDEMSAKRSMKTSPKRTKKKVDAIEENKSQKIN